MPSPFPGMDPYLEAPGLWPDVRHELISGVRAELSSRLRPRYHVRVEERVYVSDADDPARALLVPDLHVARRGTRDAATPAPEPAPPVAAPLVITTLVEEEIREARVEIRDPEGDRVVTVIELLSPSNEVPGSRGSRELPGQAPRARELRFRGSIGRASESGVEHSLSLRGSSASSIRTRPLLAISWCAADSTLPGERKRPVDGGAPVGEDVGLPSRAGQEGAQAEELGRTAWAGGPVARLADWNDDVPSAGHGAGGST